MKSPNLPKKSIDWERFSSGDQGWVSTKAYLDAHNPKTYVGLAEDNGYGYAIKFGFPTIEGAFAWAEKQVDYKLGKVIKE